MTKYKHIKLPSIWAALLIILLSCISSKCIATSPVDTRHNAGDLDLEKVISAPGTQENIINYTGMTVSFNPRYHIPNWVAWELTADEVNGAMPRNDKFQQDPNVPGCPRPQDYTRSGYDRGHMAPAGDMKWSEDAMHESFYMTNMCPQLHSLNSGAWKSLEEKCRQWAMLDSSLIIIAGPVLRRNPPTEYLGDSGVAVPNEFFKVILAPKANPIRAIGFIMPNGKVPGGMQQAAVSVDEVEAITGHDFFSELPDDIENLIESQNQFHLWSSRRAPRKQK